MSRVIVPDLLPETDYVLQVRAVGPNGASQWSPVFPLTTIVDTTKPKVPSNSTWVVTGDAFYGEWDRITQNLNNETSNIARYEIELVANAITKIVSVPQQTESTRVGYTLSFEENRALFTTPQPTVTFRARAVDVKGLKSDWSALRTATNAAPAAPTGPASGTAATAGTSSIEVQWTPPADNDVVGYRVYVGTSAGFAPDNTNKIYEGDGTKTTYYTSTYSAHYFKIRAVDKFSQVSSDYTTNAATASSPFTADTTAPSVPTGLAASASNNANGVGAYANVSWTAVGSSDLAGYVVRYRRDGTSDNFTEVNVSRDNTAIRVELPFSSTAYDFAVRSYDWSANYSAWSSEVTTSAPSNAAPSQPSAPTVASNTMQLQVTVPGTKQSGGAMEGDVVLYEVYAGTTSTFTVNATSRIGTIQAGPAMVETFPIPASAASGTNQTWYAKIIAVDFGGQKSPESPVSTSSNVNLISAVNIGDATITNAKISSLGADKIVAGTGIINDITVKSKLTLGDASNVGTIETWDYTNTGGTSGAQFSKNGIIIKSGTVEAAALRLQVGQNIAPYSIATMWLPLASTPYTGTANLTVSMDATSYNYSPQSMKIVKTGTGGDVLHLTTANENNIVVPEQGAKYIVSMYVRPSVTNAFTWGVYNGASSYSTVTTPALTAGSWQRVSFVTTAINVVGLNIKITMPTVAGTWNIDGIQVERQVSGATTPSEWKPPMATTIDGGMIKTGSIQSNQTTTVNSQTIPLWNIPMDGSASFANLQVRGSAVVGTIGDANATTLSSANYVPGSVGYQFRSDGTADLVGIGAQVINGASVVAGTLSVDRLSSGSLDQKIRLVGESSIYAEGLMGETVELGGEGFEVWGPHQIPVTHKRILNVLGTDGITVIGSRVTIFFASDAGYRPPQYDSEGNLIGSNTGTVLVRGVGTPYDGSWTIRNYSSTGFWVQYDLPNIVAEQTKVAATGTVYGRDIVNPNNQSKIRNIYFPSNGAEPNIISGLLTTNELTVTNMATLGPTTSVPAGAVLSMASGVEAPKTTASPTFYVPSVNLGMDAGDRNPGAIGMAIKNSSTVITFDYGNIPSTPNLFGYIVRERDRATGAVNGVMAEIPEPPLDEEYHGAAYHNNKLYLFGFESIFVGSRIDADVFVRIYDTTTAPYTLVSAKTVLTRITGTSGHSVYVAGGWNKINNRIMFSYNSSAGSNGKPKVYEWNIDGSGLPTTQNGSTVTLQKSVNIYQTAVLVRGLFGLSATERYMHSTSYTTQGVVPQYDFFYTSVSAPSGSAAGDLVTTESFTGNALVFGADKDNGSNKIVEVSAAGFSEPSELREWQTGDSIVSDTTNATRWIGYTWVNSDGSKQSDIGGVRSVAFQTRKIMKITTGDIPYDASKGLNSPYEAHIYVANQATQPSVLTQWIKRAIITYPAKQAEIIPGTTLSGNPPSSNGFLNGGGYGEIRTTSGSSYWRGDDTAQFVGLKIIGTEDVDMTSDNTPPLRIGDTTAQHLRIDGNEIMAMTNATTKGYLGIQGRFIGGIDFGATVVSTDANGNATVSHSLGVTPTSVVALGTNLTGSIRVSTKTSTNFTLVLTNSSGNPIANTTRGVNWFCIAGVSSEPT